MSNYSELIAIGIPVKKFTGSVKTICPKCSHTRKKRTDPCLSVNIDEGVYNCHNCGWKGTVRQKPEKQYAVPIFNENHTKLPDEIINWFKNRRIRQETLLFWKIGACVEWMPQTGGKLRVIAFNYFLDGKLVNAKFRSREKHFKLVKDAKLILYGLDTINDYSKPVVICEGEIDALTIWQCGHTQVLSVPNGASKNGTLEYLDNSIDRLNDVNQFIIWTDNDAPGIALRLELIRRLGEERCLIVNSDLKDANEVLIAKGETYVNEAIEKATPAKLSGIINVSDEDAELMSIYNNGLPPGDSTGINELDNLITWEHFRLTVVTGIPSHGKSEFVDFIMMRLMCFQNWKIAYYSPENYPRALHLLKLIEKISGRSTRGNLKIGIEELKQVKDFMEDHIFMIKPEDEDFCIDSILDHAKKLVRRNGIRALVLDPWNKLDHGDDVKNETLYISKQLDKLSSFAQLNRVHIFLVAHPTKMKKENGKFEVPTLYDIAGSAHFYNKADNGLCVYRDFDSGRTSVYVQKVKFKHIGKTGVQDFFYDIENGRYWNVSSDKFSWMNRQNDSQLKPNDNFLKPIVHDTTRADDSFPF